MRILVAFLLIVLSLPWFIAFGVFYQQFDRRDPRIAGPLGVVFGGCLVVAAVSLFVPSWHRLALGALVVLAALYALAFIAEALKRRRRSRAGAGKRAG